MFSLLCLLAIGTYTVSGGIFTQSPTPATVSAFCTFWQGIEHSRCRFENFKVVNYKRLSDFKGESDAYSNYGDSWDYKEKDDDDKCEDDPEYWYDYCPQSYSDDISEDDDNPILIQATGALGGRCDDGERVECQKSCNKCGMDNYLTAPCIEESKHYSSCLKFSEAYPFNCIDKVETKVYKKNVISLFGKMENFCAGDLSSDTQDMCISFIYRRRGSTTIRADKLTTLHACIAHNVDRTTTDGERPFNGFDDRCGMVDMSGNLVQGASDPRFTQAAISTEHCDFNQWIEAKADFEFRCDTDRANKVEIGIMVQRGADHLDFDDLKITAGDCDDSAADSAAGVFFESRWTPPARD